MPISMAHHMLVHYDVTTPDNIFKKDLCLCIEDKFMYKRRSSFSQTVMRVCQRFQNYL